MILGLGCDLCGIERLQKAMENPRFCEKVFTEKELSLLASKGAGKAQSAAGLWAAKEAALKAFGVGLSGGIELCEIEVSEDEKGAPHLSFLGEAEKKFTELKGKNAFVSISHEGDNAMAFVILEG